MTKISRSMVYHLHIQCHVIWAGGHNKNHLMREQGHSSIANVVSPQPQYWAYTAYMYIVDLTAKTHSTSISKSNWGATYMLPVWYNFLLFMKTKKNTHLVNYHGWQLEQHTSSYMLLYMYTTYVYVHVCTCTHFVNNKSGVYLTILWRWMAVENINR